MLQVAVIVLQHDGGPIGWISDFVDKSAQRRGARTIALENIALSRDVPMTSAFYDNCFTLLVSFRNGGGQYLALLARRITLPGLPH